MLYTLRMTLSGSESPPGHPRSLVLRFVGFTHSACHYYSQLLTTTQIGLATTLTMTICRGVRESVKKSLKSLK